MQNFPAHELENFGGILTFKFIPLYNVVSIPDAVSNIISSAVVLKTDKVWYTGIALLKSKQFEEDTKKTSAGKIKEYKFSGVYPGQSETMDALLDSMENVPMLLDVTDMNNKRRLLGAIGNGVDFIYSYKSGQTPSARPDYSMEFSWTSLKSAQFYNI